MKRTPTDDILHARIRTLGVVEEEYDLSTTILRNLSWKWKVYDVSGIVSFLPPSPRGY